MTTIKSDLKRIIETKHICEAIKPNNIEYIKNLLEAYTPSGAFSYDFGVLEATKLKLKYKELQKCYPEEFI